MRWRTLGVGALSAALLLSLVPVVEAQERRRGGDRRGGFGRFGGFGRGNQTTDKLTLLRSDQVLAELKVTDEQKEKIESAVTAYREESRGAFSFEGFRDLSAEEREKAFAEAQKKRESIREKHEKKLAGVLKEEQNKRLGEIHLQQAGVEALATAGVAASLKLSEEQNGKIKAAFKARDEKRTKLFEDARGGSRDDRRAAFAEMREKTEKLQKETEKQVLAVLTKEQTEKFTALKGKPFELDRSSLRGRGRGDFGGGRGRGGRGGDRDGGRGERRRPPVDDDTDV